MLMSARTARLVTSARQAARRAALICVLTGTGAAAVQARAPNNAIRGTTARLLPHLPVGRSVEKATIARLAPWHRRPLKKATMASAGPLPHVVRRLSAPRATTAVVAPSSSALRALTEAVKACQEVCDLRHANACMSGVLRLSVVMGSHPDVALVYSYDAGYRASGVFTVYPKAAPCRSIAPSPLNHRTMAVVGPGSRSSRQALRKCCTTCRAHLAPRRASLRAPQATSALCLPVNMTRCSLFGALTGFDSRCGQPLLPQVL